jgi:hypothetical protein
MSGLFELLREFRIELDVAELDLPFGVFSGDLGREAGEAVAFSSQPSANTTYCQLNCHGARMSE